MSDRRDRDNRKAARRFLGDQTGQFLRRQHLHLQDLDSRMAVLEVGIRELTLRLQALEAPQPPWWARMKTLAGGDRRRGVGLTLGSEQAPSVPEGASHV